MSEHRDAMEERQQGVGTGPSADVPDDADAPSEAGSAAGRAARTDDPTGTGVGAIEEDDGERTT